MKGEYKNRFITSKRKKKRIKHRKENKNTTSTRKEEIDEMNNG